MAAPRGASIEDTERLLVAYEQARGQPWAADEREGAWAAGLWVAAFRARLSSSRIVKNSLTSFGAMPQSACAEQAPSPEAATA